MKRSIRTFPRGAFSQIALAAISVMLQCSPSLVAVAVPDQVAQARDVELDVSKRPFCSRSEPRRPARACSCRTRIEM